MNTLPKITTLTAAALLLGASSLASAVPCYEVIDSGNNVTYRSSVPPVSLSGDEWTRASERYRKTGLHLRWYETQVCSGNVATPSKEGGEGKDKDHPGFDPNIVLRATSPFNSPAGPFGLSKK